MLSCPATAFARGNDSHQEGVMDQTKVEALAFRMVGDMAGSFSMALGHIGDRLGLFRAMNGAGPVTSEQLASKTGLNERYVREWLKAMVAAEYLDYDASSGRFVMTPEQAYVLADDTSPLSAGGLLQFTAPTVANTEKLVGIFRDGGGIAYSEMGPQVPEGIARFFGPGYVNFLVQEWLPAVPGLPERLKAGIDVADVGCGHGLSTMTMAAAFPASRFVGLDFHGASIERARRAAAERGLTNVDWRAEPAHQLPRDRRFGLVCAFDCIHDMVDPRGTLRAIRAVLADDGVLLWSEPNASDNPLDNRNPVGKAFQCVSPLHCMTVSLAHRGEGLGTVIGERGVRALARETGFTRVERVPIDNPFNQFFALRA
jgi:2-polyprenyl-3-methyl-5-hydroxy-6-metoxy-1,4-benzoquinol methylase